MAIPSYEDYLRMVSHYTHMARACAMCDARKDSARPQAVGRAAVKPELQATGLKPSASGMQRPRGANLLPPRGRLAPRLVACRSGAAKHRLRDPPAGLQRQAPRQHQSRAVRRQEHLHPQREPHQQRHLQPRTPRPRSPRPPRRATRAPGSAGQQRCPEHPAPGRPHAKMPSPS